MNSAASEIAALEGLFDKVVPNGTIIFDDYGWVNYISPAPRGKRLYGGPGPHDPGIDHRSGTCDQTLIGNSGIDLQTRLA